MEYCQYCEREVERGAPCHTPVVDIDEVEKGIERALVRFALRMLGALMFAVVVFFLILAVL